ncbi:U4/U6 small nuclear ribonucleoprotein Prp4 [Blyttiomyces sp. JEL0837]|nr:U4/U6 small nuclear ribonucleoprotein Prp4 [Blyttiomyces sp. JEL0837]
MSGPSQGGRIHFGSIEDVERRRDAEGQSRGTSQNKGGVNLDDLADETYDQTESGQKAQSEHQAIIEELERKKLARSLAVPTDDRRVRSKLQSYNEPQTLFGEGPGERRDRLREIMARRLQDGAGGMDVDSSGEGSDGDSDDDSDDSDEVEEEFYTYGEEGLVECRRFLAGWSVGRARRRLAGQRAELDVGLAQRKKVKLDWYTSLKTFSFTASQIGDERPLGYCTFAPNSRLLATGSWSGLVKLWTIPDCEHVLTFKGQKERVSGIAFHPGSTLTQEPGAINLATSGMDGTVNLHSFESDTPIANLNGHVMRVARVAFHPSGRYIGTTSYDQTWRLWDVETQVELLLQEGHSREVFAIGFQGDGSLVATGGMDSIGRVWDLRTGRSIFVLQGHVKSILSLDWSPNGHNIATGSEDNQIRIWDVRQAKCTYVIPGHTNLVSQVKFWHAGVGFDGDAGVPEDWKYTSSPPFGRKGAKGKGKGKEVANADAMDEDGDDDEDDGDESMDVDDGFEQPSLRRQLLTGGHLVSSSYDGSCKIFTEGDWKPIKSLSGLEGKVMCCDVSNDGKYISTASFDRTFKLFTPETIVGANIDLKK